LSHIYYTGIQPLLAPKPKHSLRGRLGRANWSELEFLFVPGLFGTPVDMESKFLPQINWKTGRSVIYEP